MIRKTFPLEYQKKAIREASNAMLHDEYVGYLCDMGTGKTLMSLYSGLNFFERGKLDTFLIVCPKVLMSTWEQQINEHIDLSEVKGSVFKWLGNQKACSKRYTYEFYNFMKSDLKFFVVNIEAFSTQYKNKYLEDELIGQFDKQKTFILIDESSKIKSPSANRTKHLIRFGNQFKYRAILTGTEITNSMLDIYSQFEFLKNNFWGLKNFFVFRARYAVLEDEYVAGGRTFKKVVGFQRINELMEKIQPHIIRLKKEDCLDLPEKVFQVIELDMPRELRSIYDKLKKDLYAEYKSTELTVTTKIALFTRFRQLCGNFFPQKDLQNKYITENPKLEYILEESEDTDKKAIVWCSFVDEIKYLTSIISNNYRAVSFYGEINQKDRSTNIELFKTDARFMVINPQTGAYGLNLQFCDLVYYYTLPLSPEQWRQSIDRVHRIGQSNRVIYKILLYKDSIDERIYKLLEKKDALAKSFSDMTIEDTFDFI